MMEKADKPNAERQPFPDEAVELIASHMKVVAEPCRIRILEVLKCGPGTVQEISDRVPGTTYTNVSRHLCILFQAGMVSRSQEGPSVTYSLCDWSGWWVIEQIAQAVTNRLDELSDRLAAART
jgi:DNA-binding transcriptional ArsR family regulator